MSSPDAVDASVTVPQSAVPEAAAATPRVRLTRAEPGDFAPLARQIRESGLLRRRYDYYWPRLIALPLVYGLLFTGFVLLGDSWWQLGLAVLLALIFAQTAFLGHDAAHRQIFRSDRWNSAASLVIANFFIGMSYGWWQNRHTRHHQDPNKTGLDPDDEVPVIPFSRERIARQRNPLLRWVMSNQGSLFFVVIMLEGISLHLSSIHRAFGRDRLQNRVFEITALAIHHVAYLTIVFVVLSPLKAVLFLAVQVCLFGFLMGMAFAPNHKGMPIVPKNMKLDFLRRQVMMSRNIRGSFLVDFMMGGLNYQIEHHLFPNMPRPHLRRAAPVVAAYCVERGVPYTETTAWQSYGIVRRYIDRVGLGEKDVFSCPLLDERQALS
jgi:fatty acid desaturase